MHPLGILILGLIGVGALIVVAYLVYAVILIAMYYYYISVPILAGLLIVQLKWGIIRGIRRTGGSLKRRINDELTSQEMQNMMMLKRSFETESHRAFLTKWHAKLVSQSKRGNTLYEIKHAHPRKKIMVLQYNDPSTLEEYLCFVPWNIRTADEGMSWKFHLTEEEYDLLKVEA